MFWDSRPESCDILQCERLFKNAFRIRGTPEAAVKKLPLSSRATKRIFGMSNPGRVSSPDVKAQCCSPRTNNQNSESNAIFSHNAENSTPQKFRSFKSTKARLPLEECDPNCQDSSQDSGYSGSEDSNSRTRFQFIEPNRVAPRRLSMESPLKSSGISPKRRRPNIFRSWTSGYGSNEDEINDLVDMESLDGENNEKIPDFAELISGSIEMPSPTTEKADKMELDPSTPETPVGPRRRLVVRRSLALLNKINEETPSPLSTSRVRSCLFRSPNSTCSAAKLGFVNSPRLERENFNDTPTRNFKRPEPPANVSPILVKRSRKCTSFHESVLQSPSSSPDSSSLHRSLSETETHANIKSAIHRSTTDADLTGDFSKQCVLPLAEGQHEDLKSISAETLTKLIKGEFKDKVSDYKIVDCRYPYEFEAGHIEGALNLYSRDMIEQFLLDPLTHTPSIDPDHHKRSIIVFHCEFSWERGPNLSRFLRNIDRQRNKEHYPALHYPEIYLLHGGYQMFYNSQKEFCNPQGYRPMRHPDHEADLRQFRVKSKTWQGDKNSRSHGVTAKANLKRLGLYE